MPAEDIQNFPAAELIRFFENHGMLGINTHPQWRTIRGGSREYLAPLTKPFAERIHTGVRIGQIRREPGRVVVPVDGAGEQTFDQVVFACHGDQVLPMLADATPAERLVLGKFRNSKNRTTLHTDARLLPKRHAARASWNYRLSDSGPVRLTYHMNRLQSLRTREEFCVTLNAAEGEIAQERTIENIVYEHPIYDQAASGARAAWNDISGNRRSHYCGAYWFNGFHEDGVRSAERVAESLGVISQEAVHAAA